MKKLKIFWYIILLSFFGAGILCAGALYQYLEVMQEVSQREDVPEGMAVFKLQHEDNPLDKDIEKFVRLYDTLLENQQNGYTYYEIYSQYLENPSLQGTFYQADTDELKEGAEAIYCTQISQNVIEDFQLEVSAGRLFEEADYILGEKIPALMGHGYAELYEIGDVFECNYLFDTYSFEVVGFLKEGSKISQNGEKLCLDHQIVMPAFAIDEAAEMTPGLKIHYANKTSGTVILPEENAEQFYVSLVPLLENAELGEYTWSVRPTELFFKELFGISMQTGKILLAVCCILLCAAELWGIVGFSKYAWADTKSTAIRGSLYGILLFAFTCFFYALINCVYVFFLKIMVVRTVHFVVIGLISAASVLAGRMFWKKEMVDA